MAKKNVKKTSNFLGFRLTEKTLKRLDLVANQVGKTRGIVAKDAIKQWLTLKMFDQTNEMITISKTLFMKMLQNINMGKSKLFAEEFADLIADLMNFSFTEPMNLDTLDNYTQFSINFFGKNGLKWFNTIDIQIDNNKLILRGLHDLSENFSIFFTNFYKYLLFQHFNISYKERSEDTTSNLVYLECDLKKDV